MNNRDIENLRIMEPLKTSTEILQKIPLEEFTEPVCIAFVKKSGLWIRELPIDKRTPAVYLAAVTQNALALRLVKNEHQFTVEQYIKFQEQRDITAHIPENMQAAVKAALEKKPIEDTEESYIKRLEQNETNLNFIPYEKRTKRVCEAAVLTNLEAIFAIDPNADFAEELYTNVIRQNPNAISYILQHIDFIQN
jgi:hypothetical protein